MPDRFFSEPRLAALYDVLEAERGDLAAYLAIVDELGARSVLDVGCGTGTLACLLAAGGLEVTAVDPAAASLNIARAKPGAGRVQWIHGDAAALPALRVDLALMTGNVAQVFLTDEEWAAALTGVRAALRPRGRLVFEVRDPAAEAWRSWTPAESYRRLHVPDLGTVEAWAQVCDVNGELVTFRWTFVFAATEKTRTSDSTLRFRGREDITRSLVAAGYVVEAVRGAPDRPGQELVFIARRT